MSRPTSAAVSMPASPIDTTSISCAARNATNSSAMSRG
ncbi:Uncharacterised protein [Mycobacteroides abscessus subsp. abscessus]|nr:Uncharacterised protein [Mycobacteroides abscessus subsp. abscessus]